MLLCWWNSVAGKYFDDAPLIDATLKINDYDFSTTPYISNNMEDLSFNYFSVDNWGSSEMDFGWSFGGKSGKLFEVSVDSAINVFDTITLNSYSNKKIFIAVNGSSINNQFDFNEVGISVKEKDLITIKAISISPQPATLGSPIVFNNCPKSVKKIEIFALNGKRVSVLDKTYSKNFIWNLSTVSFSGVYFYRISNVLGKNISSGKILIVK